MLLNLTKRTAKTIVQSYIYGTRPRAGTHCTRYRNERAYILAYHSVCPAGDPYLPLIGPYITVRPEVFEQQIAFLAAHYEIVSLSTLARRVTAGYDGDRPLVALTFDDGYRDNYRYAFPILRRYGVAGTFFLTTDCIDSDRPLWPLEAANIVLKTDRPTLTLIALNRSWDLGRGQPRRSVLREVKRCLTDLPRAQRELALKDLQSEAGVGNTGYLCDAMLRWHEVREMRDAGMEFGSHTCSHPSLPFIPLDEAKDEIVLSKKALEDAIGEAVVHFCYPNPSGRLNFNATLSEILRTSGFETSVNSESGYVEIPGSPYEMKRKGIYSIHRRLSAFYCHLEEEAIKERRHESFFDLRVDGGPTSR